MLSMFSCADGPVAFQLWRNVYSNPLPIFNHAVFLLLSCKSFLIFWIQVSYKISFCFILFFLSLFLKGKFKSLSTVEKHSDSHHKSKVIVIYICIIINSRNKYLIIVSSDTGTILGFEDTAVNQTGSHQ